MRFDVNPINDEIAILLGFQWRLGGSSNCRFLSPPDTAEGCEIVGVNTPRYTMDEAFPLAAGGETICCDYNRFIPRFCEDDAEALRLQVRVARLPRVHWVIMTDKVDELECEIRFGLTESVLRRHESAAQAIATACRDCLRELAADPPHDPLRGEPE